MAAELRHESSARRESAVDCRQRRVRILDPVQYRVAEHRVELPVEVQVGGVRNARVQSAPTRRPDLFRTRVDGHHAATGRDQLLRQGAVTAADVEDALSRLWTEQLDHRRPEVGHEPRVRRVLFRIPDLHSGPVAPRHGIRAFGYGAAA